MKLRTALSVVSMAVFANSASAAASDKQSELVIVDIKAVAGEIARNARLEASEIPLTIRAPVDIAAKACGIPPSVLGAQGGQGGVSCAATTTFPALERLVKNRDRQQ